jgi:hypothetical protein
MKKREESYDDSDDAKNLIAAGKRETADYKRSQMSDGPGATESLKTAAARMGARPPMARTSSTKGPIVTKEQMKKAGFDNLRDYLNAERGLTRRKDAPAAKPAPNRYIDKKSDDDLAYRAPNMGDAGFMAKRMTPNEVKEQSMRNRVKDLYGKKSGGMVKSSASKRADGIAIRGKTRA